MSVKSKDDNEGIEYLAMHIPTKKVIARKLLVEGMSKMQALRYLHQSLAQWNRLLPGVWQYYTK